MGRRGRVAGGRRVARSRRDRRCIGGARRSAGRRGRRRVAVQAPSEDGVKGAVLQIAGPGDDEVAVAIGSDPGLKLIVGGVGVDLKLDPLGHASGVEPPQQHLPLRADVALPSHDEVAIVFDRDRGQALSGRGVGMDLELAAQSRPHRIESLPEDAVDGAWLARPHHDEAARRVVTDRRVALLAQGRAVDQELDPLRDTERVEAPPEDTEVRTILAEAGPGDDEVAVVLGRHRRGVLPAHGGLVDLELSRLRGAGRVVATRKDAAVGEVLLVAGPGDDEVTSGVGGDGGVVLVVLREGVDLELRAERRAAGVEQSTEHAAADRVGEVVLPEADHTTK